MKNTAGVSLREVTKSMLQECINLKVADAQLNFVWSNVYSLAEAKVNPTLTPLAVYDRASEGYESPRTPMIGFTMYEVTADVGFILRLMIDQAYQGQGYGRATMVEVIRRLKLYPQVQLIGTSHAVQNTVAAKLYRSLGFVSWNLEDVGKKDEVFLKLEGL